MSEMNQNVGVVNFGEVVVTSDKKFKPREEFNNLCQAHLVSVEIKETITPKVDDKGVASTYEYAGVSIPTLVFKYKEETIPTDEEDRYYTDNYRIVTTTKNDGSKVDAKTYASILTETYRHCRHRLDAYVGTPNFKEPGFPKPIDMNAPVGERIEQWRAFCQFFVDAFNKGNNDKPVFVNEKDEPIVVWIKLIAHYPDGKYLSAPGFVGEGYIERVVDGKKPAIELKPGETVKLSEGSSKTKETPASEAGVAMGYGAAPTGANAQAISDIQNKYAGFNKY